MSTCMGVRARLAGKYESSLMQDDVISELTRWYAELLVSELGLV